jgi:sulfate/thiosulfate transport system ATP-binding protein
LPWTYGTNHDHSPGGSRLQATVLHVNSAGPIVRIQLRADGFENDVSVEITPQRYAELRVKAGDTVYISPQRVRVFVPDDYSI